jgi:hypothetical protein
MRSIVFLALIVGSLGACVPVDEVESGMPPPSQTPIRADGQPFADLDAGAYQLDSLHFRIRAYGQDNAKQVADGAEASYQRIMQDTNLYSFQPRDLYHIVVYGSQQEYDQKTLQPVWSGGCSVGNSIYTFSGPLMQETIAHEMTHLIWYEYMGRAQQEQNQRWLNEGLAVYEELKTAGAPRDPFTLQRSTRRVTPLTVDQLENLVPATEREKTVSLWYAESEDFTRFLIERGGRMGFSQFMQALKDGRTFDDAVNSSYVGQWRSLADAYQAWQNTLQ